MQFSPNFEHPAGNKKRLEFTELWLLIKC